jgi:chemotaxis protein CheD
MSESESGIINVDMSDMKVASNNSSIRSAGIGSCIVITLYDPQKKIGAMAHPMLAENTGGDTQKPLRFVDSAISAMIMALEKAGASKERLEAKIVGGANMFKVFDKNPDSIGIHNAEAAQKKLEAKGIKIVANDTGGNVGRAVVFELKTGIVEVKTKI